MTVFAKPALFAHAYMLRRKNFMKFFGEIAHSVVRPEYAKLNIYYVLKHCLECCMKVGGTRPSISFSYSTS